MAGGQHTPCRRCYRDWAPATPGQMVQKSFAITNRAGQSRCKFFLLRSEEASRPSANQFCLGHDSDRRRYHGNRKWGDASDLLREIPYTLRRHFLVAPSMEVYRAIRCHKSIPVIEWNHCERNKTMKAKHILGAML